MSETTDTSDQFKAVPASLAGDVRTAGCGFLMGAADIVPGVSGGTVALILGVYERLVTAISRCNAAFLKLLFARKWKEAAEHLDLRFVVALGCGILTGIVGLASLMEYLLTEQMSLTFAAFTGMILASSLLVARRVTKWHPENVVLLAVGTAVALRLVTLQALQNPPDTLWYMFFCGMIGITAMILPGISGAFILLLLSRYHYITHSIKDLTHGIFSMDVFLSLVVFACGCLTGLLGFSKVLRWLLAKFHDGTMAVLCGFMLGSLYKLWPFQRDTTPEVVKFKHKIFENFIPDALASPVLGAAAVCVLGVCVVLTLDAFANRGDRAAEQSSSAD